MKVLALLMILFSVPVASATIPTVSEVDLEIAKVNKLLDRVEDGLVRGKVVEQGWRALKREQREIKAQVRRMEGNRATIFLEREMAKLATYDY